jgi:hypothetical protein
MNSEQTVDEIDMHDRGITDIAPIIKLANSSNDVRRINLSNNNLSQL